MVYLWLKKVKDVKEERGSSTWQKDEIRVAFIMYVLELYYNFHVWSYPITATILGIN